MQAKLDAATNMVTFLTKEVAQSKDARNNVLQRAEASGNKLYLQTVFHNWVWFHCWETSPGYGGGQDAAKASGSRGLQVEQVQRGQHVEPSPAIWGVEGGPMLDAFRGGWLSRNGWGASLPEYPGPRRLERREVEVA